MTAPDVREQRRAGLSRVARGVVMLALSPVAFQLAAPLSSILGFVAKAAACAIGFALSATGTKRVVIGSFEAIDAANAPRRHELPSARVITESESERRE